ncbi:Fe-S cluster domain protein [Ignisphaera aggregans DSM 17230]|uniref:Fe-S cluster domain protein n=1 Tax=Ignisphaera aggregans (strain DSM 17230 / JCM 13409 / AQ1.S1) TaxID=583356 RepID=E0SNU8_IGNAA|nr:Fe-S cluster domain protein [Ignisphaera aggregans DSM 17230]
MKPYVVRFISYESGRGKTKALVYIAQRLISKGYKVSVIKHAFHGIDIEDKDSHIFILNSVEEVVVSSRDIGVLYINRWVDSLEKALTITTNPIVLVEGFRESEIGDVIAIAMDCKELENLVKYKPLLAILWNKDKCYSDIRLYDFNELDEVAEVIENRAVECILNQLPKTNCGFCGYSTCREFSYAYLRVYIRMCPTISDIRLMVNDIDIPMNPFVKNMLFSLVQGFLNSLKNVPRDRRRISIEIKL